MNATGCRFAPPLDPQGVKPDGEAYAARVSSQYGWRTGRGSGQPTFHAGLDLWAPVGATVYSPMKGSVVLVGHDAERRGGLRGYGNALVIQHPSTFEGHGPYLWSMFAHMSDLLVGDGATVEAGTPIGRLGRTSNGRFPRMAQHLHIELRHATRDGRSPFPGPYNVNNLNPDDWLAANGVDASTRGITWNREVACGRR